MKRIFTAFISVVLVAVIGTSAITVNATEPTSIESGRINMNVSEFTYTGEAIEPSYSVTLGTKTVPKKYLDVTYSDNINAGVATISVSGKERYTGTLTSSFTINPLDISSSTVIKKLSKTVVGSQPKVMLSLNGVTLVKDVDYSYITSGFDKAGIKTGIVSITGMGNFTSTKNCKINVYPDKVKKIKNVKRENTAIEISWQSQSDSDVTGYKVYTCDANGENKQHALTVTDNSAKITGLSEGKYYFFTVRAFKKNSKNIIYGDYSRVYKTCTVPSQVIINCVAASKDSKTATAEWKKVPCSGYEIKYSTDKSFKKDVKSVTLKDSSSTKYKFKTKADKTYYVKVRAFRKYDKTTVKGKWSPTLTNKFSNLYSTYTSKYVNNKNRTTNLRIASKAISGTILEPGETFSFNGVVGKRTTAKGYKSAHVFNGANTTVMGTGGGVCQVASTMFNATLLANLQIVERHQHSQRVTYVPLGRDAAIYWGSEDYKFKNNTNYPIKIVMTVKDGKITCAMYTSQKVKPKKVKLSVTRKNNNFTLKRYVDKKCNYTTHSHY